MTNDTLSHKVAAIVGPLGDRSFRLGDARVNPVDGSITQGESSIHLEPKVMAVLLVLCDRPGEIVTSDELIEQVWDGRVVTRDVVARCIYQLRSELPELLGLEPEAVIETLRKRGYRLKVAPRALNGRARFFRTARWVVPSLALGLLLAALVFSSKEHAPESLAVLPFANMTGETRFDALADGLSEQIAHVLANQPGLMVSARSSSFFYKNRQIEIPAVARGLGVDLLVDGSVRRQGAQLRVTVQMVRSDGFQIWSKEYDRPQTDLLRLQTDIADAVLVELGRSTAAPRDANPDVSSFAAYDRYLRGRFLLKSGAEGKYQLALNLFHEALEISNDYALAFTGIADAYSLLISSQGATEQEVGEELDRAIAAALELDSDLAEAHASRGLRLFVSNQYAEAEAPLRQSVALNPNYVNGWNWLGLTLVYQDRFGEAIEAYRRAQQLDPLDVSLNRNLGANLLLIGRRDEGLTYLKRAYDVAPSNVQTARMLAGWSLQYGLVDEAISLAAAALERFSGDSGLLVELGSAHAYLGDWTSAESALSHAYRLSPEDSLSLERTLALRLAMGDLKGLDEQLAQTLDHQAPDTGYGFGFRRVTLRWRMIRLLVANNPQAVVKMADEVNVETDLTCNSFGEPGPRLYLAHAARLIGRPSLADNLVEQCLQEVQQIIANGATYPRSLYRAGLTLAVAGQLRSAQEQFTRAVDAGWRAYRLVRNDPLLAPYRDQPEFSKIFAAAKQALETSALPQRAE